MSLSKPQIIAIAACPTCCAMRGEPCTFSRCDDPNLLRTVAKQSHLERIKSARKQFADNSRQGPDFSLDGITLKM
jgi:hypothetical protein